MRRLRIPAIVFPVFPVFAIIDIGWRHARVKRPATGVVNQIRTASQPV